jgi:hypothetical protein
VLIFKESDGGQRRTPGLARNQSKPYSYSGQGSSSREDLIRVDTHEEVYTVREPAQRTHFNENYVSGILDLAVFSPEMTEAIFGAHHDPSLTAAQLITYTRVLQV